MIVMIVSVSLILTGGIIRLIHGRAVGGLFILIGFIVLLSIIGSRGYRKIVGGIFLLFGLFIVFLMLFSGVTALLILLAILFLSHGAFLLGS